MRPIMILAGYDVIRALSSGPRDFAQIFIDGVLYYIGEDNFSELLKKMVIHGVIQRREEWLVKCPGAFIYRRNSGCIDLYHAQFETDEYRQWVEKAQTILVDLAYAEFDEETLKFNHNCNDEEAEFCIKYLNSFGKIEGVSYGRRWRAWRVKKPLWRKLRECVGC